MTLEALRQPALRLRAATEALEVARRQLAAADLEYVAARDEFDLAATEVTKDLR